MLPSLLVRKHAWSLIATLASCASAIAAEAPPEAAALLEQGQSVQVLVEFDATAIERTAAARRARLPTGRDNSAMLADLAQRYRALKLASLPQRGDVQIARDYSQLPMLLVRLDSPDALQALVAQPGVRGISLDRLHQRVLAQSLPLVSQPAVLTAGLRATGSTVAVLDDGIDITQAAFGGCTGVATPASCRVVAQLNFASSPAVDHTHGTNVSAIVAAMAADARIASLNVFGTSGALSSDILSGINWAITQRSALNIVALNMSLGDGSKNTTACSNSASNPFVTAVANARNAGITVVVAAGNGAFEAGSFVPGLSNPACVPGAVSVGAVYDVAVGGLIWNNGTFNQCTDAAPAPDQVTCFSNSAGILTLLAPGALVTAGGFTLGGTSQAAPMVAGAVAVLRTAFPSETLADTQARLTSQGMPVTDPRSGLVKPRLNLLAAARPANDAFTQRVLLSGASGSINGSNRLATHEPGEPADGGGTSSVWWQWTAPTDGQLTLNVIGTGFTLFGRVYAGTSLPALTSLAGPTSGSPLRFQAQAGLTYVWLVDSVSPAAGDVALSWSLNTAARSDLVVTLVGPATVVAGEPNAFTLTVRNNGPQVATHVHATVTVPAGWTLGPLPTGCSSGQDTLGCDLAELLNGASNTWALQLSPASMATTLAASASCDVPDPKPGDNIVNLTVVPSSSAGGDIPTLPAWGTAVLAAVLALSAIKPLWIAPRRARW